MRTGKCCVILLFSPYKNARLFFKSGISVFLYIPYFFKKSGISILVNETPEKLGLGGKLGDTLLPAGVAGAPAGAFKLTF